MKVNKHANQLFHLFFHISRVTMDSLFFLASFILLYACINIVYINMNYYIYKPVCVRLVTTNGERGMATQYALRPSLPRGSVILISPAPLLLSHPYIIWPIFSGDIYVYICPTFYKDTASLYRENILHARRIYILPAEPDFRTDWFSLGQTSLRSRNSGNLHSSLFLIF